jgi:CheY-like chemotaxis protein
VDISPECEGLGETAAATVYHIAQDCLSNALRHGNPRQIAVSVGHAAADGEVIVAVTDDGGGMRKNPAPGYGLIGMKERVRAMDGCGFPIVRRVGLPSQRRCRICPMARLDRQRRSRRRETADRLRSPDCPGRAAPAASRRPAHRNRRSRHGREAIRAFREARPDVVILDLHLPGVSGMEVLGRLEADNPGARVVVVSMYDNPAYVARVLQAGARGYVSKNAPPEQILEAIKRVAAGGTYIDHETAQELAL